MGGKGVVYQAPPPTPEFTFSPVNPTLLPWAHLAFGGESTALTKDLPCTRMN
jgi:hypothetical protein